MKILSSALAMFVATASFRCFADDATAAEPEYQMKENILYREGSELPRKHFLSPGSAFASRAPASLALRAACKRLPDWLPPARVLREESPDPELTAPMREHCRLDVYYPGNSPGFATVVWFHAGGLTQGKRYVPGELMKKGIAVVAVDYRLSPAAKAPAYIEDAAAAVAWTFKNIASYGGSDKKIFVAGASAGGYLACMVGLDRRWLAAYGIDADRIAGLGSISGQAITHFTVREERGLKGTQPVIDDLAPLFHVRADAPPLLIVTGDRELELLGRYEENAYFWRMMKIAGHNNTELRELKGLDHAGVEAAAHPFLLKFVETTKH